jgi:hypothetical protein
MCSIFFVPARSDDVSLQTMQGRLLSCRIRRVARSASFYGRRGICLTGSISVYAFRAGESTGWDGKSERRTQNKNAWHIRAEVFRFY